MAMTKCKACGREVSTKAEKCPNCGEPLKRKSVGLFGFVGLVLLVGFLGSVLTTGNKPKTAAPVVAQKPAIDCTNQPERERLIKKMVDQGYWDKVHRPATLTRVHVMPEFMRDATFDEKTTFLSVVSAWDQCAGGDGLIILIDAITGEEVGSFNEYGLDLD